MNNRNKVKQQIQRSIIASCRQWYPYGEYANRLFIFSDKPTKHVNRKSKWK